MEGEGRIRSCISYVDRLCKTRGHHSPYQRYSKCLGMSTIMPGMSIDLEKDVSSEV